MAPLKLAVLALACAASSVQPALAGKGGLRGLRRATPAPPSDRVRPLSTPDGRTPIHLLISAFQDGPRCANTIFKALQKAEHPGRVTFNVLQAAGEGDVDCKEEFRTQMLPKLCRHSNCSSKMLSRVRYWKIALEEGKGPVHQRGILSERADISGKDSMCLSTDSHMDFTKGWDRDLLADWTAADNEFAVLTSYPMSTTDEKNAGKKSWISTCGYFLSDGVPRGATGGTMFDGQATKPKLTMNWAAGQSFARCHAERNVPVDKNLRWMFNGEEVNRAVRLYTHGYDLYNPSVDVVLHNYSHASQKFWSYTSPTKDAEAAASRDRLQVLLQGRATAQEFGHFALGSQRSIEDYVTWAHTDLGGQWRAFLEHKGIEPMFEGKSQPGSDTTFCEQLKRVPVRSPEELVASIGA
eukprot:CAMPEP_0171232470 /NCGR_PEP_ID=MMETSP0790-20130122/40425_1 /TAXON_ID=2925 /ORGANISM="Alexandrium catenella, Strain OF101" /LENGTH=409 /DNA_ID=CAMNT_0011698707 /DNA_START=45 /DNA_END=1274 /DNA_ORIENTATION=-